MPTARKNKKTDRLATNLIKAGLILLLISGGLFLLIFYKVIYNELAYRVASLGKQEVIVALEKPSDSDQDPQKEVLVPVDKEFGIVIPKIRANSKVIKDVNPYDAAVYQVALTKGVAHAQGSVYPGYDGNVFLFAHSSGNFYDANRYNSIFYLLNKMEAGDEIDLFYQTFEYKYKVVEVKIVDGSEVKYLKGSDTKKTLTLMTCWPAGTTAKRLLVIAEQE